MTTTHSNPSLESLYRPLWLTYGLVPLLAGLDKFFNLLTDWPQYLSPVMAGLLPVSPETFMYAVGIIEMAVGVMILTRWTRLGAWIAAAWLVLIALNLVTMGLLDIAVRDLAMAVGAYTLARLAELRQEEPAAARRASLRESRA
ncbi:MAG TPA: DoxX family membrane protein [Thermoanaerobaculia bacterium]|nr:DoxX family membrane protein [Thermoanaerobaculia bacterium]